MYHYESPSVTFEDDYTSNSGWTQTGSKVTVDSGKLDWVDANAAATNDSLQQVIKSLGITLSDTAWTTDFIYINNGGTVGGYPFVFQSATGNYDSASNDAITMSEDNPNKIKINTKNGGTYVAGSSTIAVSSGTTYYIRIQRTSATDIKLSAFTDSARTTHTSGSPVTVSNAGIANITGLTYVQHQNQTTGGGGTTNFEVTDLKIYNGVTSVTTPATWTMEPTFRDDFSSYADTTAGDAVWATNDTSRMRVNPTTDVFDFTTTRNGSAATSYKTLSSVSDTAWLLRFRYNMTSSTSDARLFVGFSSTTGNYGSTEDWLGIIIPNRQHTAWSITSYDNAAVTIGAYSSFSLTPVLATDYFIQITRTSATELKLDLYSDSAYTVSLGTVTRTIPSTVGGLSYLKIMNMNNDSAGYTMTGIIDDIEFYNGVTSIN
jgi:hypothetical protein